MIALADPAGGCRTRATDDRRSRSPILSEHRYALDALIVTYLPTQGGSLR
jgi:hypothetical protein